MKLLQDGADYEKIEVNSYSCMGCALIGELCPLRPEGFSEWECFVPDGYDDYTNFIFIEKEP